jgi:uncharacterized membrane protein
MPWEVRMTVIDSRLATTLRDESGARSVLNDVHQQILNCRDTTTLAQLMGQYVAAAVMRQMVGSQPALGRTPVVRQTYVQKQQMEARIMSTLSNIMKTAEDTTKATISNIKG